MINDNITDEEISKEEIIKLKKQLKQYRICFIICFLALSMVILFLIRDYIYPWGYFT